MNTGYKFKMHATDEQILEFQARCDLHEGMLAATLARRIENLPAIESVPLIVEWFKTVRQMAVASHLISGIKIEVLPIPEDPA